MIRTRTACCSGRVVLASSGTEARLRVEIAEDREFTRLVSRANAKVTAASDWTCRVLVGNLKPSRIYWYRFIDAEGGTSRVGRTLTAPRHAMGGLSGSRS